MIDADKAQVRIIDATDSDYAIATELTLSESLYEKKYKTLTEQNRYCVNEQQLDRIDERYSVATDF